MKNTFDHAGNLTGQSTASTRQVNGNSGKTETTTVTAKNTFDFTGRLVSQTRDDGQNTAYAYDGLGRTVSQTLPTGQDPNAKKNGNGNGAGPHNTGCGIGGTTPGCPGSGDLMMFGGAATRVFNDGLMPIAWATATLTTDLVYGPQGADHQLTTTAAGSSGSWLYLDRQGTVRATAGADGVTTSASAYTDFGVLEPAAGTLYAGAGSEAAPGQEDKLAAVHLPVATTRTPVGYTGEQTNPVAGLQHYYTRDYQPSMTQWLQADTWRGIDKLGQTLNRYAYVLNNPATLVDYLGYWGWGDFWNVAGAVAVGVGVGLAVGACIASVVCGAGVAMAAGISVGAAAIAGGVIAGRVAGYTVWSASQGQSWAGDALNFAVGSMPSTYGWGGVYQYSGSWTAGTTSASSEESSVVNGVLGAESPASQSARYAEEIIGDNLRIVGQGFSASERRMAQALADQGHKVVLREADPGDIRTSDLLVDGVPYDVYTPKTGNVNAIVSNIASKGSQVRGGGVVLDLSNSPLTAAEVGNLLPRVQGVTSQISDIIVMGG